MARLRLLMVMLLAYPAIAAAQTEPEVLEERSGGDWSGASASLFGGAGISSGNATLGDFAGVLLPMDVQYGLFPQQIGGASGGAYAGVGAGYSFQSDRFVGGVEGDIGYAWVRARHFHSRVDNVPISPFPGIDTDTRYETDFGLIGTLRLRGGFALNNTQVYATAGAAVGQVSNRFELALPQAGYTSPNWSSSGARFGYALGVGVEHRLTQKLSLKAEAMFIDLEDTVIDATDPAAFPGESISYRFGNSMILPRLAITYRF